MHEKRRKKEKGFRMRHLICLSVFHEDVKKAFGVDSFYY